MSVIRVRVRVRIRVRERERRGVVGRVIDRFRGRHSRGFADASGARDRSDGNAGNRPDSRTDRLREDDAGRRDPLRDPDRHNRDRHNRDDLRDTDDPDRRRVSDDPDRHRVRDRDDQLQDVRDRRDSDDPGESHRVATSEYWERRTTGGACPLCIGRDGERWDADPGNIELHPNCRCRTVHVRDGDRQERDDISSPLGVRGGDGLI